MGSEFCSCENLFVKTENESNMLCNSKKEFSTIDKKNTSDKRFEEESFTNEKYNKLKNIYSSDNNKDTLDKPTNNLESKKKKGLFDINKSLDNDNKENENKINEIVEKNQKENINVIDPKNKKKKKFYFSRCLYEE